jgi:D-glycero-D-manno-heptose 1,7-bisphosphate phosphatase
MNKAVFFDRDGVINNDSDSYYIIHPDEFTFNKGVKELLSWLKERNYILIIISNQGGVSRGICTLADIEKVHLKMQNLLKEQGTAFDEVYYCPHHPDNENCICRKPDVVNIEKAIARFSINSKKSFFVGDRDTDMEAGMKAGLNTIRVEANQDMSLIINQIKRVSELN